MGQPHDPPPLGFLGIQAGWTQPLQYMGQKGTWVLSSFAPKGKGT